MTDPSPVRPLVARTQRVLPAPPEVVFDEWLSRESLAEWMCPRPARCVSIELEPWLGGKIRFDIEENGVEFYVVGRFKTLDRPHRLAFSWNCSTWNDPGLESIVTVRLSPHGDGQTLLELEHSLLPFDLIGHHERGWVLIVDQLAAALANRG